jgi:cysteine desulfurase
MNRIYLDYAATTPVDRQVVEAMLPYFGQVFGNPSSTHTFGQQAEGALEDAREMVAGVLNSQPRQVVFTSCGTESDNLALRGAAWAFRQRFGGRGGHILISPVEHHAVSHTAEQLAKLHGFELEYLPVDEFGMVSAEQVARRLREDTAVVSVIYANNEIGTINPIAEIGAVCRERSVLFHTDAVQAATYLSLDTQDLQVDLMAIGAHKFYGPKGVGALYIRNGAQLIASQTGGGQEFNLRAGTHNIPYIAGMAHALRLAEERRQERLDHILPLRDRLVGHVLEEIPASRLTGHPTRRLPNHASFVFEGVDGNALLMALDAAGFACSSGSACKTGDPEPSEVLTALGLEPNWALGSLRVTLGDGTTVEEVNSFLKALPDIVDRMRSLA